MSASIDKALERKLRERAMTTELTDPRRFRRDRYKHLSPE